MHDKKCAITGCGFVGASAAFCLMESGMFSDMILIDANKARAEGEVMDLSHALPLIKPMHIWAGEYSDLGDADLIIVTAGANQKVGETRIDLVQKNAEIIKNIIPKINQSGFDGILLIVSNPVDILTRIATELSNLPQSRVLGSGTVLDTARLKYYIGRKLGIDGRNVDAYIIGEHGDSELPVWSSANISGVPIRDFCSLTGCEGGEIDEAAIGKQVVDSAYQIIEKKGATYYAIAMSVKRIAEAIVRDEHSVLSVSSLLTGEYGISGVCMGIPSIVSASGVEKILHLPLSSAEKEKLTESAKTLKDTLEKVGF